MYFPYFRGRQYEMLALKELASEGLLGGSVIPVVEPIKLMSTFDTTLKVYSDKRCQIALIFNPAVGDFAGSDSFVDEYIIRLGTIKNVIPALLMSKNTMNVLQCLLGRVAATKNKENMIE